MKAVQWSKVSGGIEKNITVNENAALPKKAQSLSKDSVLVKIAYASLNPVDYRLPELPVVSNLVFSKPAIPGNDFAGTVVASTRSDLEPGDRVFGLADMPFAGTMGEFLVVSDKNGCVKLPEGVSLKEAATIGVCGLTAYQCIVPLVKPGGKVFINGGSGGTGTYGIQVAKAIGCYVTTTCSGPNVELCKSLGADEVIDYRTNDVLDTLKRSGTQYDLLVDNASNPALYWNSQHFLKPDGLYVTIGGGMNLSTIYNLVLMYTLPAWLGGGQRKVKMLGAAANAEQYTQVVEWMKEGKVKAVVEKEFELKDAVEAFQSIKTGHTRGKLILKIAGE